MRNGKLSNAFLKADVALFDAIEDMSEGSESSSEEESDNGSVNPDDVKL